MKVFGTIYVMRGKTKKALNVYVGEADDKKAAIKLGTDFLRERAAVGLAAEFKVLDSEAVVAYIRLSEPKPLEIEASELDMLERGLLT